MSHGRILPPAGKFNSMITEPFISYVNVYCVKIMLKFVDVRLADFCYQPLDNT